jgi:hypothetical protein
MNGYEYIRTELDVGDLTEINSLGASGWRVAHIIYSSNARYFWAILERPLDAEATAKALDYYTHLREGTLEPMR